MKRYSNKERKKERTRMRECAGRNANAILDAKIARESEYKRLAKPTVLAEHVYTQVRSDAAGEQKADKIVRLATKKVDSLAEEAILQKLSTLTVQGKFAEVIKLQGDSPFFKSIMFDLPHKQHSFLMRGCADVLPSFANLRRWGKVLSWRETTHHVLNCCDVARKKKFCNM